MDYLMDKYQAKEESEYDKLKSKFAFPTQRH